MLHVTVWVAISTLFVCTWRFHTTFLKNLGNCELERGHGGEIERILHTAPLIDGHNDFPIWLRAFYGNHINNLTDSSTLTGQVDLPRLRSGRLRTQFWSGYVPCPADDGDFSSPNYYEAIHDTLQQIDLIHRLHRRFPDDLKMAHSSADVQQIFESSSHQVAGLIGLEGLHQIGNSASILRVYHLLGVRYITLTHDCNNHYADAALATKPVHGGLSEAGKELIREMNRLGMIVDLAHVSADTMRDALAITKAPVIFSHSNAYTLHQHPRNVPDDVLQLVKYNNGVVMVTFYPEYLSEDPDKATLQQVVDNIMHIGTLIGFEHVGIGSDFDGMDHGATGLEDVSKYPDLLLELLQRGVEPEKVVALIGNNALRVLTEVEQVAEDMLAVPPLEDIVRPFFGNDSSL